MPCTGPGPFEVVAVGSDCQFTAMLADEYIRKLTGGGLTILPTYDHSLLNMTILGTTGSCWFTFAVRVRACSQAAHAACNVGARFANVSLQLTSHVAAGLWWEHLGCRLQECAGRMQTLHHLPSPSLPCSWGVSWRPRGPKFSCGMSIQALHPRCSRPTPHTAKETPASIAACHGCSSVLGSSMVGLPSATSPMCMLLRTEGP